MVIHDVIIELKTLQLQLLQEFQQQVLTRSPSHDKNRNLVISAGPDSLKVKSVLDKRSPVKCDFAKSKPLTRIKEVLFVPKGCHAHMTRQLEFANLSLSRKGGFMLTTKNIYYLV